MAVWLLWEECDVGGLKLLWRGITHSNNHHRLSTCCAMCNASQGGSWEVEHRDMHTHTHTHSLKRNKIQLTSFHQNC